MISKYYSLVKTFLGEMPSTLTLFVTNQCNAKCKMCFNWENIENSYAVEELSMDEISRIANGFEGLHSLIISGGEPFLRKDLDSIINEFYKRSDVRHVSIPTNLFCRDAPERIRHMAIEHPDVFFRILISLDGIGKDHDIIRGHEGGFNKLIHNYERLVSYKKNVRNLSLNIVTVLTSYNSEKIHEVLNFAGGLEADDIKLIYVRGKTREPEAKNVDPGKYEAYIKYAENLSAKKDRTKSFYNNLFGSVSLVAKELIAESLIKKNKKLQCNAGAKFIVVSASGEVYPCETMVTGLGNLRQHKYNIHALLKSEKARKTLEFIREGKCRCTMDCNTISNVIYSPSMYFRVLKKLLFLYGHGQK